MPDHSKVLGKAWADEQRTLRVAKLQVTLAEILAVNPGFTFEVGCGHGHWLAAYAQKFPEKFCLGIDLITTRVDRSTRKQTLGKIENVTFLKAEATEFLDALLPVHQLKEIFILYPDPWPKTKHHKNRFINQTNLSRLAEHAPQGTRLHFRTDDLDYYQWCLEHLNLHPAWKLLPQEPWPFERTTFFEERMKEKRDLIAEKQSV
jgi:tRNA (guanine-N7-)-methyltransferase